ncbi:hypothetical protein [Nemorincola caseinilytica]|uniref:hypothetical protein n=1 Tax=Nemorincola caseinilytica TaxID=2054315 RepID=UPI0031ECF9B2
MVFNLFRKDAVRLVFLKGVLVDDGATGILQGDHADGRRLASFSSIKEVNKNKKTLQRLVKELLQLLQKG